MEWSRLGVESWICICCVIVSEGAATALSPCMEKYKDKHYNSMRVEAGKKAPLTEINKKHEKLPNPAVNPRKLTQICFLKDISSILGYQFGQRLDLTIL